jgi:hypothetical protein
MFEDDVAAFVQLEVPLVEGIGVELVKNVMLFIGGHPQAK